jgi:hypothetical protein
MSGKKFSFSDMRTQNTIDVGLCEILYQAYECHE